MLPYLTQKHLNIINTAANPHHVTIAALSPPSPRSPSFDRRLAWFIFLFFIFHFSCPGRW
jgi:hypothetical protein